MRTEIWVPTTGAAALAGAGAQGEQRARAEAPGRCSSSTISTSCSWSASLVRYSRMTWSRVRSRPRRGPRRACVTGVAVAPRARHCLRAGAGAAGQARPRRGSGRGPSAELRHGRASAFGSPGPVWRLASELGELGVELAVADRGDHRPVLVVHQGEDVLLVLPLGEQLGVARPLARQHLPADVDEALDERVRDPLVLRLDVEDHLVVADVGVVAGDHAQRRVERGSDSSADSKNSVPGKQAIPCAGPCATVSPLAYNIRSPPSLSAPSPEKWREEQADRVVRETGPPPVFGKAGEPVAPRRGSAAFRRYPSRDEPGDPKGAVMSRLASRRPCLPAEIPRRRSLRGPRA